MKGGNRTKPREFHVYTSSRSASVTQHCIKNEWDFYLQNQGHSKELHAVTGLFSQEDLK